MIVTMIIMIVQMIMMTSENENHDGAGQCSGFPSDLVQLIITWNMTLMR